MSYAAAAQEQLDNVIAMTDALLALSREVHEPVDLAPVVRRMNALLAPVAKANGRALEVGTVDELGTTSARGNAVRSVIGACLLSATDVSGRVRCEPIEGRTEPTIRIESCDGAILSCDDDVMAVATRSGVRIEAEPYAIFISFPR